MTMSIERTKARLAIKIFSIFLFLVLLLWSLIPFLIPKNLIETLASDAIGGKVFIEEMSLRPFGHQTIQNLEIESDLLYGSIEFLETDAGFWWLLLFPSKTNMLVEKPKMIFSTAENLGSDEWDMELFSTPLLDIQHGSIQFDKTLVEPIQGSFQLQKRAVFSSIELQITTEGQTGGLKSSIDCRFKKDLFDEDGDLY